MAKLVELHEICYKIAKCSLRPMETFVELQNTCFKTAIFSLGHVDNLQLKMAYLHELTLFM